MGDFNHGNIKWDTLQSTGVEDSTLLCLVQDNFLTQHVFEPTRAARVLNIVLSSQKEFVDNVEIQEPLGSSDHNQLHFNINIKSDKTRVKQCRRDFRKGNYREIRKNLAHIDWDEKMKNKTATEYWDILRQGTLGRTWVSGPAHTFSVFGPTVMYYYSLHKYLLKYTLLNYHILNYDVCSGAACDINAEMCPDGIG